MKVRRYLDSIGAWCLKTISNGYQRAGVPDLIVCYKGRFIGIEVKATHGRPSALQKHELEMISRAGGEAILLYPKDFEEFRKMMEAL